MLSVEINNDSHKITSIDAIKDYSFARVNFISLNKSCSDIKKDTSCSSIMLVNGNEYYITKSPVTIHDGNGKSIDVGNDAKLLPRLNDENKIFDLLTLVNQDSALGKKVDVTFVSLLQSCSDCLTDSYCAWNCSYKPECSWSTGCHARSSETVTAGDHHCDINHHN